MNWRAPWRLWSELDRGHKIGVGTLVLTALGVVVTYGVGAGWFSGGESSVAGPGTSAHLASASTTTEDLETTTTTLDVQRFEYDPSPTLSPQRIGEGESYVFFSRDERGLTVQIGAIDDDLLLTSTVSAFVTGEAACLWRDIGSASGRLIYRTEQSEYEITVDVPWQFGAEVRVAKRVSGDQTGSESCEPTTE